MRLYGTLKPTFWTGPTGKELRGHPEAQIVAMYLVTGPHANMIGLFRCPVHYIAADTGLPFEGASKGLQRLTEVNFCQTDDEHDLIWVFEMARYQIAETLKPNDNRIKNVASHLAALPKSPLLLGFYDRYEAPFHLQNQPDLEELRHWKEGASKALLSQRTGNREQEQPNLSQGEEVQRKGSAGKQERPALAVVSGNGRGDDL